jgi:hypothetical protein
MVPGCWHNDLTETEPNLENIMTIAEQVLEGCVDMYGQAIPLTCDLVRCGGVMVDNSNWGFYSRTPYVVWEFPDESQIVISGTHKYKITAR